MTASECRMQNAECRNAPRAERGVPNTEGRTRSAAILHSAFCILHSRVLRIAAAAIAFFPTIASACPVCFGDPNSSMTKGTNNGIFFLLGIIGFVQIGFVTMFWSFWRRSRALRARREAMRIIDGGQFR